MKHTWKRFIQRNLPKGSDNDYGASVSTSGKMEQYGKIVCLSFFLSVASLSVMGQVNEWFYSFSTEKVAEKFGNELQKDYGIFNMVIHVKEQWYEVWRVIPIPTRHEGGKPILRDDFTTKADAEKYVNKVKDKFGILCGIIERGDQQFWVSFGTKTPSKYIVVVGSYPKLSDADAHGRELNIKYGYDYEIIPAAVKGGIWYRVSVFDCDDEKEAKNLVAQWKQKHDSNVLYYKR